MDSWCEQHQYTRRRGGQFHVQIVIECTIHCQYYKGMIHVSINCEAKLSTVTEIGFFFL